MGSKILLVLVLLALFGGSVFAWTGSACATTPTCTKVVYVPTSDCGNFEDVSETACTSHFYAGAAFAGEFCSWFTGAVCTTWAGDDDTEGCCAKAGNCICYSGGSCTTTNKMGCTAVPEFFGIEFGDMQLSTGIIALIAAIVLPTILFRKKK